MTPSQVIAVTDTAAKDETLERSLAAEFGAEYRSVTDGADLDECLENANVVFTNFQPITAARIATLADEAVIIRYGIGVDNVDLAAAARHGVRVANVPDYGANVVADHTALLIAAVQRRLMPFVLAMRDGQSPPVAAFGPITSFEATTVGLIGAGRIARLVAARMQAFGCTVLAHDPYANEAELRELGIEPTGFRELLQRSDVVSLHAPLTEATHHLLSDDEFTAMKPNAVLVNTSRGGLVDSDALLRALDGGRLTGAGLDVTDPEPLPSDSPLRSRPDVILTPHVAFYSTESMGRLQELAVDEGRRALQGVPLRCPVPLPS